MDKFVYYWIAHQKFKMKGKLRSETRYIGQTIQNWLIIFKHDEDFKSVMQKNNIMKGEKIEFFTTSSYLNE